MLKLLPLVLALMGTGAGVGAGFLFKQDDGSVADSAAADECAPGAQGAVTQAVASAPRTQTPGAPTEFVKMSNHFVVPVLSTERVEALVVASLSLEVDEGRSEAVYDREPRLRDAFLQVMLDHASIGGFSGQFTSGPRMESLRIALRNTGREILGPMLADVLITEIARQDT